MMGGRCAAGLLLLLLAGLPEAAPSTATAAPPATGLEEYCAVDDAACSALAGQQQQQHQPDPQLAPPTPRQMKSPAKVCIVIRTYWGHGKQSRTGLRQLFESFERQAHQK